VHDHLNVVLVLTVFLCLSNGVKTFNDHFEKKKKNLEPVLLAEAKEDDLGGTEVCKQNGV